MIDRQKIAERYQPLIQRAEHEIETYKRTRDYPGHTTGSRPIPRHSKTPQRRAESTIFLLEKELGYEQVGRFFTHGSLSRRKEKLGCDLHVHLYLEGLIVRVRYVGTTLPRRGIPKDSYSYPNAVTDVEIATTKELSVLDTLSELDNTPERSKIYRRILGDREPWLINFLGIRAYNPEHEELVSKVMAQFKFDNRDKRSFEALEEAVNHWLKFTADKHKI